jgi:dethiobiotin synthetase
MQPLLITGTDTGVGKTVLTASLAAYWQTYHSSQSFGIYKPIQSGEGDREYFYQTFSGSQTFSQALDEITPIYFDTPIAPAIASVQEGKPIDLGLIWHKFQTLQQQKRCLLVEAMGGLGSPITDEYTVADLANDWKIATVLVVPLRLGAIGQAVANVALANSKKINLKGIVLSCAHPPSHQDLENLAPIALIQSLTNVPVLGVLPYLSDLSDISKLAHLASRLELEMLGF